MWLFFWSWINYTCQHSNSLPSPTQETPRWKSQSGHSRQCVWLIFSLPRNPRSQVQSLLGILVLCKYTQNKCTGLEGWAGGQLTLMDREQEGSVQGARAVQVSAFFSVHRPSSNKSSPCKWPVIPGIPSTMLIALGEKSFTPLMTVTFLSNTAPVEKGL